MKKTPIFNFLRGGLCILSCILAFLLFGLNFLYTVDVTYDTWEQATVHGHLWSGIIMVAAILLLVFACTFIRNVAHKIDEKKLFWGLAIGYSVMALYLILNVTTGLRADANLVYTAAQNAMEGNYIDFSTEGYIHRYPHQLGLLVYDTALSLFSTSPLLNFTVNFLFVLGINFLVYKISDHLFANHSVNLLTMLVSFAFLPQLLFILFGYGLTPGFFFIVLAFYSALKFADGYQLRYLAALVPAAACAVLLKNNYMIGVIAIIIFLILKMLKLEFSWKGPVAAVLLVLCLFLPHRILASVYENITGEELDNGAPAILWVAMGTDLDNHMRAAGWYDGTNWNIYNDAYYDKEVAQYFGEEKMKENLTDIKENPGEAWDFFTEKTITQWCEPMYQSAWIAAPMDDRLEDFPPLLQSLYAPGAAEDVVAAFSKFLTIFIWLFAGIFFLLFRKKCFGWEMLACFTVGGFLFHTVWEAKSQYIYPYLFVLIPLAAFAFWKVIAKIKAWKENLL